MQCTMQCTMSRDMTRSRSIKLWFAAVALIAVVGAAFGVALTISTGITLLALCVVPPALKLWLWPAVQLPILAEERYGSDHRDAFDDYRARGRNPS
jgi:hypothetical protein